MNDKSKTAYRSIIYHFLLDIRTISLPLTDEQALIIGRYAGPVAYQLHNLALASVKNFAGFNESEFWIGIDAFNQRNPDTQISHYRKIFEQELSIS